MAEYVGRLTRLATHLTPVVCICSCTSTVFIGQHTVSSTRSKIYSPCCGRPPWSLLFLTGCNVPLASRPMGPGRGRVACSGRGKRDEENRTIQAASIIRQLDVQTNCTCGIHIKCTCTCKQYEYRKIGRFVGSKTAMACARFGGNGSVARGLLPELSKWRRRIRCKGVYVYIIATTRRKQTTRRSFKTAVLSHGASRIAHRLVS